MMMDRLGRKASKSRQFHGQYSRWKINDNRGNALIYEIQSSSERRMKFVPMEKVLQEIPMMRFGSKIIHTLI